MDVLIDWSANSSLILASVDLILPRAHVRMWWVLWQSQASHWTTCQACYYAPRSYPDLSRRITTLLGALFREVSSLQWWGYNENAFRPLPLTDGCLQARDWTSWNITCTFDPSHIKLIHITWTNRQSWGSDMCVHAQRYIPVTVSCHPHVFFDYRPSGPC